jgi:predicted nucleotide-binding protein
VAWQGSLDESSACPAVHLATMSVGEDFRSFLQARPVEFKETPCQGGTQFRCGDGEIFTAYESTGKILVQGNKNTALAQEVQAMSPSKRPGSLNQLIRGTIEAKATPAPQADRRVFIVYGHDVAARDNLELVLRRMKLEPIILQNLPAEGDTIIEKLERYLGEHGDVGFACVLLTPDDEGYPAGQAEQRKYRARQNVILELGMVLARLGRRRVVILHKGSVELPSDIGGLIYRAFQERVEEVRTALFQDLRNARYQPDEQGLYG